MRLTLNNKRIGEILVEAGIITTEQLQDALDIQVNKGNKLGNILSAKGIVNEETMLAFVGKQCGISYVSLKEFGNIPQEVMKSLPETILKTQNIVPIEIKGDSITIAVSDPFNISFIDDIILLTGLDVIIVISSETEIKHVVDNYLNSLKEIDKIFISLASIKNCNGHSQTENTKAVNIFSALIEYMLTNDIHELYLEPHENHIEIRYRLNGLERLFSSLSSTYYPNISYWLKTINCLKPDLDNIPQKSNKKFDFDDRSVFVNLKTMPTIKGESFFVRINDPAELSKRLDTFEFDKETLQCYLKHIKNASGIIMITGPADSGKSTTLYSIIKHLADEKRKIVCIDNYVDKVFVETTQIQLNNMNGFTSAQAIDFYSEHASSIITVSGMNEESAAISAVKAAQSGHILLISMASQSLKMGLLKFIDLLQDKYKYLSEISLISNQRLIRNLCPKCKKPYEISATQITSSSLKNKVLLPEGNITVYKAVGCESCNYSGYYETSAIYEFMDINENLPKILYQANDLNKILEHCDKGNYHNLVESAWNKVTTGVTSMEEMFRILNLEC